MIEAEPGDVVVYGGIDYFAASNSDGLLGCEDCAFDGPDHRASYCKKTPCYGVVWLTQADYIIHRLTS